MLSTLVNVIKTHFTMIIQWNLNFWCWHVLNYPTSTRWCLIKRPFLAAEEPTTIALTSPSLYWNPIWPVESLWRVMDRSNGLVWIKSNNVLDMFIPWGDKMNFVSLIINIQLTLLPIPYGQDDVVHWGLLKYLMNLGLCVACYVIAYG